ncbi:hypothetical protein TEA_007638 [Camellia sinensis var. sinensis]|uniref:non-specific serine/threonine protein kinase n=1 Tax=Camellia sinensis var. sinensis TaxID=542762 RepID=A0A4S4CXQ5_CAMSN|nr:hypothetical protein TEA_007638 [Camellia sinensis var. sinensis]
MQIIYLSHQKNRNIYVGVVVGIVATVAFVIIILLLVEALKQIGKTLGKYDWNFSGEADPCSWAEGTDNNVTCNCTSSTLCHITMISLKSQNLPGTLPTEFVKLPFLKVISLLGNRLTGSIPKEIGNISTLRHITLEFNQLSGTLPPELGNLFQINDIHLTSNYLTGELPGTLAKLITLTELGIQASGLDGPIPQEIASLTKMTDLRISDLNGMEATFPLLNSMTNMNRLILRSCNITGPLPNYLANLTKLKTFFLTGNCLSGPVPDWILKHGINISCFWWLEVELEILACRLKILISFLDFLDCELVAICNRACDANLKGYHGGVNANLHLAKADRARDHLDRAHNQLTSVDSEVIGVAAIRQPLRRSSEGRSVTRSDLSYNNFGSGPLGCQQKTVNLFASSSNDNLSQVSKPLGIVSCLRSFQCPQSWSSFYINCGGKETFNGSTKYEDDLDLGGPAKFVQHGTNWAFSTTGLFLDDNSVDSLISTNTSRLSMRNSELYMDARLSPTSLTYYGFCLINGNYTVKLHFAEIMFTNDETFSSLGRRIFDIYIQEGLPMQNHDLLRKLLQGKLERKDFNIEKAAGGVGKETIQTFTTVVTNSTLEIRLYWAGQGTTGMPRRGVYGPLISAISVYNPDYLRQLSKNRNNISVGVVLGIVAAVAFVMILLLDMNDGLIELTSTAYSTSTGDH